MVPKRWLAGIALWAAACMCLAQYETHELDTVWARANQQVRFVSSATPAGLAGSEAVRKHLAALRKEFGGKVASIQERAFPLAIPETSEIALKIDGAQVRCSPLWPNDAATNTWEFQGESIWFDPHNPANGISVKGRVAFLRFASGDAWVRAFELGATGVVFIADQPVTRIEAEAKFTSVPAHLPRFLAITSERSVRGIHQIRIRCRQQWARAKGSLCLFTLQGSDESLRHERLLIGAHLDGVSIAPDFGVGQHAVASADAAAALLRYFLKNPPRRTLQFAFYDGHCLALKGERVILRELLSQRDSGAVAAFLLDLTDASPRFAMLSHGELFATRPESRDMARRAAVTLRQQANSLARSWGFDSGADLCLDGVNESDGKPSRSLVGTAFAAASEPFLLAGLSAITCATADDARVWHESPAVLASRSQTVQIKNLELQTKTLAALLDFCANQPSLPQDQSHPSSGIEFREPRALSLVAGFSSVSGKSVRLDASKGLFPNTPIPGSVVAHRRSQRTYAGVRGTIIEVTDEKGDFAFDGLPTVSSYWHSQQPLTQISSYFSDPETGKIRYVSGEFLSVGVSYPDTFSLTVSERNSPLVAFPCDSSPLFSPLENRQAALIPTIRLINATSGAPPQASHLVLPLGIEEPSVAEVFYPQGTTWLALFQSQSGEVQYLEPVPGTVGDSALNRAKRLSARTQDLSRDLAKNRLIDTNLLQWTDASHRAIQSAQHGTTSSNEALAVTQRTYGLVRGVGTDVTLGLMVFCLLGVPFLVFSEALFLGGRKLSRRLGAVSLGFVGLALMIYWLHPAFVVVQSPAILFVATILAGLSSYIVVYLIGRFDQSLESAETIRSGGFGVSLSLALSGLRRRRVSTSLMLATVSVLSLCVIVFSSIRPALVTFSEPKEGLPDELIIHEPTFQPIRLPSTFDEPVSFVRWRYAGTDIAPGSFSLDGPGGKAEVRALISLSQSPAGRGKSEDWIELPPDTFRQLKLMPGATVRILGVPASVRAASTSEISPSALPIDYPASGINPFQSGPVTERTWMRFAPSQVALISESLMAKLGGSVRLGMAPRNDRLAASLSRQFDLRIVSGRRSWRTASILQGTGLGLATLALLVGAFFVVNSLAASAISREKEIRTLLALGASPRHILSLFVAESLVLGTLGCVVGMLVSMALFRMMGSVPGLELNVSSTSSVFACLAVFAACMASSAIPAHIASKGIRFVQAQSLLRPNADSDDWSIVLPFAIDQSDREVIALGLQNWLSDRDSPASDNVVASQVENRDGAVRAMVWLAPFELAVSQEIRISFLPSKLEGVLTLQLDVRRQGGDRESWIRSNGRFVGLLRGVMLDWHTGKARSSGHAP